MIDQFNRINQAIGANRIRVAEFGTNHIQFQILGWSEFVLSMHLGSVRVLEVYEGIWQTTARSRWLHGISLGKKRDDAGVLS